MDKIYSSIKRSLNQTNRSLIFFSLGVLMLLIGVWLVLAYLQYYQDRFYPITYVDDINISGLKKNEAKEKIRASLTKESQKIDFATDSLVFVYQDKKLDTKLSKLEISDNLQTMLDDVFTKQHNQLGLAKIRQITNNHFSPSRNFVKLDYNPGKIQVLLDEFKKEIDIAGQKPTAKIIGTGIEISSGITSTELLIDETKQVLQEQLFDRNLRDLDAKDLTIEVVIGHSIVTLDPEQIMASKSRAEKFLNQSLTLELEFQKINLSPTDLLGFLKFPSDLDQDSLNAFVAKLQEKVNRPSNNASFTYNSETLQVTEFIPDQNGLEVDAQATKKIITDFLDKVENSVTQDETSGNNTKIENNVFSIPLTKVAADITLEKTNNLGIKEVIGFGESWYAHSIPNRIFNVSLATDRISNHIIKPGEEFSFNKALGEVSSRTGYKNAYVIEGGQTKLSAGGGVCQVSSTLFRSLMDAGVKITKRLPHAYRVSYYEIGNEPGFDATVYSGETDLRFVNDTPGHVLISCQSDSEELYMYCKLYGTSDGRSNEIINYKKWGATGPLPTVYIPDPSLRHGQLVQIDWAVGGIKSEFTNVVRDKNGTIMHEDYYYSSYRPWAAKYLRGV